jgi:hypothetical protein
MSRSAVDLDRCQDDVLASEEEITMKQLIESGAARIAAGKQSAIAFDVMCTSALENMARESQQTAFVC